MAQKLIVEGKDSFVVTHLCMKRGLQPPKGYKNSTKYSKEFVKDAGGISNVYKILKETLNKSDVTNIGIIVDANDVGPEARFSTLKQLIETTLDISIDSNLTENGFIYQPYENLTIGIWIMPDNLSKGYLEHFIAQLIPEDDKTWSFTHQKINELINEPFCAFSTGKQQKALIHTWLAWQKEPGFPMGLAISTNYLNGLSSKADSFVEWFQHTFELEK